VEGSKIGRIEVPV